MTQLVLHELTQKFGPLTAVNKVSLTLNKGESLAFIGPNGAGKSTTMRMITGFWRPTSGTITVNGISMLDEPLRAKKLIGYLPENAPLYPNRTVYEFLWLGAQLRTPTRQSAHAEVERVMQLCELQSVRNQMTDTLSKGYRHRVSLAYALLGDPEILVLDEPTDGLDPNQKQHIRALIRAMAGAKAIIVSTHILEEVEQMGTRVILIDQGTIRFDGTVRDFLSKSASGRGDDLFRELTQGVEMRYNHGGR